MSKKSDTLIVGVSITLVLVLIIIFFIFRIKNRVENFEQIEKITVDRSFYDLTQSNESLSSIFSKEPDDYSPNNKIGASNLCIYKTNGNNSEITDIECIASDEFRNALKLPDFRKTNVCIDEECITIDDVLLLQGKKDFKLGNNWVKRKPNRTNWKSMPVVKYLTMPAHTCSGHPIIGGINTLGNSYASDNTNTNFIIDQSQFTIDIAEDATPGLVTPGTADGTGGAVFQAPSHD
jgi:hypothetical protein